MIIKEDSLKLWELNVTKSNDFITRARYDLTINQQKLLLYLISLIQPWDEDFHKYQLNITDFAKIIGISENSGSTYEAIKEQIRKLADKSYWITLEEDGEESELLLRWIDYAKITKKSGNIELRLSEQLKPYLLQLKKSFTSYQLIYTLHFKSKHSIRLYELACMIQYDNGKSYTRSFTLETLRHYLDCDSYTVYRDFRRDVLEKAIEEINKYSDKTISYQPLTKGRKVAGIELTVESKGTLERIEILAEIEKDLKITEQLVIEGI